MNGNKRYDINIGDGETWESYHRRITELLSRIEWQSEGHRQWYTHKNPYGCWICEILQVARNTTDYLLDRRINEGDTLESEEEYNIDDEPINTTKSEEL